MAALPYPKLPAGSPSAARAQARYRRSRALWLAIEILDPAPDQRILESLAEFAQTLTPVVVLKPGQGLLLEVRGSLKYFSSLAAIKKRLSSKLEQCVSSYRLATAPTPLAAVWLARCKNIDITDESSIAGIVGGLPLAATAWPGSVQIMLRQMGLRSIADCLRLPRAGFARRVGRAWLDELDRALGKIPDFQVAYETPQTLSRAVEFTLETLDRSIFAAALTDIVAAFERELRQRQKQIREVELEFRYLRREPTEARIRFVDPVHRGERILRPLLARMERLTLSGPAIGLSLETGILLPLAADCPELSLSGDSMGTTRSVPEYALVECLRGRFGVGHVHGIDWVAEHRPERAWRRWIDRPGSGEQPAMAGPPHERPLWLLPQPKWGRSLRASHSDSVPVERIESGWWDGRDIRRDYHIVVGAAGEKLWLYRDCETEEWYLHGIFG